MKIGCYVGMVKMIGRIRYPSAGIKDVSYDNKKINAIIASGIVIAVLLTVVFIMVPILYFASVDMEKKGMAITETALNGLTIIIKDYEQEAKSYATAIALNPGVKQYIETRNAAEMAELLIPLLQQSQLDAITVTDVNGIVISRAHAPTQYGDSVANQINVQDALNGKALTAIEKGADGKLRAGAVVPVKDEAGRVIGVVSAGYSLEGNTVVDTVKEIFKTDATLFSGTRGLPQQLSAMDKE